MVVFAHPKWPHMVHTDASTVAVGAVSLQRDPQGKPHIIHYMTNEWGVSSLSPSSELGAPTTSSHSVVSQSTSLSMAAIDALSPLFIAFVLVFTCAIGFWVWLCCQKHSSITHISSPHFSFSLFSPSQIDTIIIPNQENHQSMCTTQAGPPSTK